MTDIVEQPDEIRFPLNCEVRRVVLCNPVLGQCLSCGRLVPYDILGFRKVDGQKAKRAKRIRELQEEGHAVDVARATATQEMPLDIELRDQPSCRQCRGGKSAQGYGHTDVNGHFKNVPFIHQGIYTYMFQEPYVSQGGTAPTIGLQTREDVFMRPSLILLAADGNDQTVNVAQAFQVQVPSRGEAESKGCVEEWEDWGNSVVLAAYGAPPVLPAPTRARKTKKLWTTWGPTR